MKKTHLYLILKKNTTFVKVGITNDFDSRFSNLNNHPEELIRIATYHSVEHENDKDDINNKKTIFNIEQTIHKLLKTKHVKREWFNLDYNALKSLDGFLVHCCDLHPLYNDYNHSLIDLCSFFMETRINELGLASKKAWQNYSSFL